LEVPAALIAVLSAPPPLRKPLAEFMAHLVTRPVARAPQGTRYRQPLARRPHPRQQISEQKR
jgi:hypothetical protein